MRRFQWVCLIAISALLLQGAVLLGQEGILRLLTPNRTRLENNLKQVGLAMHNYHDVYKTFPAAGLVYPELERRKTSARKANPHLLSWRVRLLPFLGESALFDQFNFNEPWDSPTNKPLLEKMPDVYKSPGAKTKPNHTVIQAVTMAADAKQFLKLYQEGMPNAGPQPRTAFDGLANDTRISSFPCMGIRKFRDGTRNSILIVEVDAERAVPWTKPDDLAFSFDKPWDRLGTLRRDGFNAVFADGSVAFIPKEGVSDQDLRQLFFINDRQPLAPNLRRMFQRVRY